VNLSDDYLLPNGVLRNKLGIEDRGAFEAAQGRRAQARELTLPKMVFHLGFNFERLSAIHRHLFQDVFEWAGEMRTVGIAKQPGENFAAVSELHNDLNDFATTLRGRGKREMASSPVEFLTEMFAELNYIHPFREGNGRTQRAFWSQYAAKHGSVLDWSRATKPRNHDASRDSMRGDLRPLRVLIKRVIVEQDQSLLSAPT
jgi:cell filamentation protein